MFNRLLIVTQFYPVYHRKNYLCLWLLVVLFCFSFKLFAKEETNGLWQTNIPFLDEQHLAPEYWIAKLDKGEQTLLTKAQIDALNNQQFSQQEFLHRPLDVAATLANEQVISLIEKLSKVPSDLRYNERGRVLTKHDYSAYINNLNLRRLTRQKDPQQVLYGLVTQRASLRTFPTFDRVFSQRGQTDIDRFQESAVFPGEAVAILHTSADRKWYFIQNYHYRAWVEKDAIAIANKSEIAQFINAKHKLVVTGNKVFTTFNPNDETTSTIQLDMGVTLPLLLPQQLDEFHVHNQHILASYVVSLPTRNGRGELVLKPTLIPRSADVNLGYLAMTQANIIKQAFKFLGERYGWGHDFNARDCTGFIGEIFKTFGLLLPRNTSQQEQNVIGSEVRFNADMTVSDKLPALTTLKAGDMLFLPGHVAMFIGFDQNEPFIIHDVFGLSLIDQQGQTIEGTLNGVSVTPLMPFEQYLTNLSAIKRYFELSH